MTESNTDVKGRKIIRAHKCMVCGRIQEWTHEEMMYYVTGYQWPSCCEQMMTLLPENPDVREKDSSGSPE